MAVYEPERTATILQTSQIQVERERNNRRGENAIQNVNLLYNGLELPSKL